MGSSGQFDESLFLLSNSHTCKVRGTARDGLVFQVDPCIIHFRPVQVHHSGRGMGTSAQGSARSSLEDSHIPLELLTCKATGFHKPQLVLEQALVLLQTWNPLPRTPSKHRCYSRVQTRDLNLYALHAGLFSFCTINDLCGPAHRGLCPPYVHALQHLCPAHKPHEK